MSVLHRKVWRDLRGSLGVLLTVVAIIAVGAGSLVGLRGAQRVLIDSQHTYYRDYRFADFWIDVKKAPLPAVERIAALPGVGRVEARVVFDVILDLPGVSQPLSGRLLSVPADNLREALNGICLVRGSWFSEDRPEEIIISDPFAKAHDLQPGDRVSLILNRKKESFIIAGTAISPEYVYMVRGAGDIMPDPEHFGVLYVKERYARDVLDFQDACNQVTGKYARGFEGDRAVLLDKMERMLDPYGVLASTPRDRQASHRFLSDEINGLGVTAAILPVIFLLVAALVLNILMNRLAERQRSVIGTLKALGYSDGQVLRHFLSFGLVVGLAGGIASAGLGTLMAMGMIEIYRDFYQFPQFVHRSYPDLLALAMAISVVFSVTGTAKGVWGVLKLHPAEAMRSRPPERGGAIFLERFPALWKRLGFRTHMALRSMMRHPARTLTGIFATSVSAAIVFMTLIMYDSTHFLLEFQFEHISHSDADIGMRDEQSVAALYEARDLPGVWKAEPVLGVMCRLRNGWRSRRVMVTGLCEKHELTTPRQRDLTPIDIPSEGLAIARKLAEILGVGTGDRIELTPVRGRRQTVTVRVASIVEGYFGLDCYASQEYLSRLVGEAAAVNGVQLAVVASQTEDLYRAVKDLPNAQGLTVKSDARRSIEATLTESMAASLGVTVLFAGVIAFGSMLNASMVEIGDRVREISTLRVLGYDSAQVAGIFIRQNLVVFVLGVALAVPMGYGLTLAAVSGYDTELFRMPVVFRPVMILMTGAVTLLFVLAAQWFVYRAVCKLDWLEGTKVRE